MRFAGLDTAQVNLGVGVLDQTAEGSIQLTDAHVFVNSRVPSDFAANRRIINHLEQVLFNKPVSAVAVEAPAYSAKYGAISIGTIHGTLTHELVRRGIPFLYVPPGKLKYFARGPFKRDRDAIESKQSAWNKKQMTEAATAAFGARGWDKGGNMADAAILAVMAYVAEYIDFKSDRECPPTFWPTEWSQEVFLSAAADGKQRKAGILHRPHEFFWTPSME